MRWHILGTDAATGQEVELALDHGDSAQAVQAAHDRHIVVSQIRPGTRAGRPRFLVPLTLALVIALGAVSAGLYIQDQSLHGTLDQAVAEQNRLANSVARAQQTAAGISSSGTLSVDAQAQIAQLAAQLDDARSRMSSTQQELTSAHQQVNALEQSAAQVAALQNQVQSASLQLVDAQKQLQASQALAAQLRTELDLQSRRRDSVQSADAQAAAARIAALQTANADLAGQIDKLKAELLVLAARVPSAATASPVPVADPMAETPTASPTAVHNRWALTVPFADLQSFLILRADGGALAVHDEADDLMSTSALSVSHAVKLTLLHDRPRERVYAATLSVSLAADAPPVILADNKALIADFLHVAAPALKDAAPVLTAAAQLSGQDASHRQVFLTEDAKITLWNDKTGVYTIKVEAAHAE